jgi:hypothetical protein
MCPNPEKRSGKKGVGTGVARPCVVIMLSPKISLTKESAIKI